MLALVQSPFIQDLQKGLLEEGFFLLKKIHLNVGKNNKPFLRLIFADKTGHLPGIIFGTQKELEKQIRTLKDGEIVKVSGIIEEYQETIQLKVIKIEKDTKNDWELSRFWKRTPYDRRNLYKKLKKILATIKSKELKQISDHFLTNRDFMKLFLEAPASRFNHYAYIGGLLEHTFHIIKLLEAFSQIYTEANRELMILGGFLAKIGKVDEYRYLLYEIDHSDQGKLKGHTILGYERIEPAIKKANCNEKIALKLQHILLSHQGRKRWGAVVEPRFLEAYLVHAADQLNASQFFYSEPKRNMQKGENWSKFISVLGKDIYLG